MPLRILLSSDFAAIEEFYHSTVINAYNEEAVCKRPAYRRPPCSSRLVLGHRDGVVQPAASRLLLRRGWLAASPLDQQIKPVDRKERRSPNKAAAWEGERLAAARKERRSRPQLRFVGAVTRSADSSCLLQPSAQPHAAAWRTPHSPRAPLRLGTGTRSLSAVWHPVPPPAATP